ncbi:DUF4386 domain-containing protein [Edaphobacter flagellatus]|uniref:DUF4386 domain-containing protein n=1 Tax=Edaphobacter flagellatus TaxID=1933044 RepID=UPI0021B43740|nr:DUF4386 domain-containing protein [Edaphobacter flagellatus]
MTQRADARAAGIAYLSYIVFTMSSSIIYGKATAGDDVAQQLSNLSQMLLSARVTILLDLLQVLCALVLAVTLYRLTKTFAPSLALFAMMFRVGEGLFGALPILSKLELIRLVSTHALNADAAGYSLLANYILSRPDEQFSEFCFVVGGFVFAYLLLRGRMIPSWLAWIGVITIGVQMICVPLHMAGFVKGSIVNLLWMPILAYEIPLGFWLIFKGVEDSHRPIRHTAQA